MPLQKGYSSKTVQKNISEMMKAGKPRNQAVSAAMSQARKAKKKTKKKK